MHAVLVQQREWTHALEGQICAMKLMGRWKLRCATELQSMQRRLQEGLVVVQRSWRAAEGQAKYAHKLLVNLREGAAVHIASGYKAKIEEELPDLKRRADNENNKHKQAAAQPSKLEAVTCNWLVTCNQLALKMWRPFQRLELRLLC